MKKCLSIVSLLSLLLALTLSPAFAGKPVDNDGDGFRSNVDCNDNDPLVNPDAIEICFDGIDNNCDDIIDEGCSGPVDADADGYDNTQDCNDNDPAINPGVSEICGNSIDDNCDGNIDEGCQSIDNDSDGYNSTQDCNDNDPAINPGANEICGNSVDDNCDGNIDEGCGGGTDPNHGSLVWSDYPSSCISCHGSEYSEMADSTHYKWVGETTEMTNQNGTLQGKLTNAVNSYCINILGDWKVCGKCHVGRGLRPDDQAASNSNIDCLMCHNEAYAKTRTRLPDGSMAPPVDTATFDLNGFVQNIAKPTRTNCLVCHAFAGGGNAVKRGDLSMSGSDLHGADLAEGTNNNSDANFDVHMNTSASDLQCQACHVFQNHKTIGRGSDLRPTDDLARGSEVKCTTCHTGFDQPGAHQAAGANRVDADRHVLHVACQACHIDEYAKVTTETHRDWQFHHGGVPADGASGPGHPELSIGDNLTPAFRFWNRTNDNYLLGDPAVMDQETGTYPTSRPIGDLNDGKLYPFKYKTATQPMVIADNVLVALDTLEYLALSGDVNAALESGLTNMGYPANEPVEWVDTDTYQLLNHGVAPASAVDCAKCHAGTDVNNDSELDLLGYKLKGPKEQICAQCHRDKRPKSDHDGMHSHVDKGAGMDCLFCHSFTRQTELGGIGPCDTNASDFVDNIPFAHPECN